MEIGESLDVDLLRWTLTRHFRCFARQVELQRPQQIPAIIRDPIVFSRYLPVLSLK